MNGWANHSTWNFMVWHGDELTEQAEAFAAHFAEASTGEVVDDIYAWAWEATGAGWLPIGFARDAASQAFHDIDWTQVADRVQAIAQAHLVRMED